MYFQSPTFLHAFLPIVLLAYYLVPAARGTMRNGVLFAASVFFYTWGEKEFVRILLGSLIINYGIARHLERTNRRKLWLCVAVLGNLSLLGWLKYSGFIAATLGLTPPNVNLPIGVSFFTFQAISYVVDVYRRDVPAERSFLRFGVYVFLFPHLIAGPIVRYADLAASLSSRDHTIERFADGVRRFTIGLAKKLLLADTIAIMVDLVFKIPPQELACSAAWIGILGYSLQIYFDFSGYSDMAIGLGKMFGFDFAENFNHPYSAKSVTDFWRRWHISLSSWFRDYVYIPLGGSRGGPLSTYRNLLIVFILCGLWHGANWTFLAWGLWHGLFLILERMLPGPRVPAILKHLFTIFAVMLGWVFFRSQSFEQAFGIFAALFGQTDGTYIAGDVMTNAAALAIAVGCIACLPVVSWLPKRLHSTALSVCFLAVLLFLSITANVGSTYSAFIYFRF